MLELHLAINELAERLARTEVLLELEHSEDPAGADLAHFEAGGHYATIAPLNETAMRDPETR